MQCETKVAELTFLYRPCCFSSLTPGSVTVLTVAVVHMPEQVSTANCGWVNSIMCPFSPKTSNMYFNMNTA